MSFISKSVCIYRSFNTAFLGEVIGLTIGVTFSLPEAGLVGGIILDVSNYSYSCFSEF